MQDFSKFDEWTEDEVLDFIREQLGVLRRLAVQVREMRQTRTVAERQAVRAEVKAKLTRHLARMRIASADATDVADDVVVVEEHDPKPKKDRVHGPQN